MSEKTRVQHERGAIAVVMAICLVPLCIMMAVVADLGRVWVARQRLENGVEAAATAAAQTWMISGTTCAPAAIAMVSADGSTPSAVTCTTSGTRRRGVVRVHASESSTMYFSALVGRSTRTYSTDVGVKIAPAVTATGLRPFALCAANPELAAWIAGGMQPQAAVFIPFETTSTVCGGGIPGNWGILDFNGGSNSTAETNSWVSGGYQGTVTVGDVINGNVGAPSPSIKVTAILGQDILLPLFANPTGNGSNADFTIVGIAKAKFVSIQLTGSQSKRGITLQFETGSIDATAGTGTNVDYGVSAWGVCSINQHGVCP